MDNTISPYPSSGKIVYARTIDYINKMKFMCMSPIYYTNLPEEYIDGLFEPIYSEEKAAMGRSMCTIAQMIDMRSNNIPFELINKKDLPTIKEHLDIYVAELYNHRNNPDAEAYLLKLSTFQRELTRNCEKLIANDKTLKKEHIDKNLFELIMGKGKHADWIMEQFYVTPT